MTAQEFNELLSELGLTVEKFSKETCVPLATIRGWTTKRREKIPSWVESYLLLFEENKNNKIIICYLEAKHNKNKEGNL